jgi:uncharacterized protein involved in exopolysaccharide biosynthesis
MDQSNQPYDDEITLKELILKIQEYWRELWKNWLLIGLICLPFLAFKLYQAWSTPAIYPAVLTFMVDEDEGNRLGAMASILGQIGLSGLSRGKYNLDRILEVSKSRRVLQLMLFSRCEIDGQEDLIANHLIRGFDLHDKWEKDTTGLKDFVFTHGDYDRFNRLENRVLKTLQGLLNGTEEKEGAYKTSYNENTGIMTLRMDAPSPDLSIAVVDTIFAKLTVYYIESSTEKANSTYEIVKSKKDSLAQALSAAEYRLAQFVDQSQNIYSAREGSLQQSRLTTEVQRLQVLYGEVLKNLEYADFTLKSSTPFITLLDNPIPPIRAVRESKIRAGLIGLILGIMVGVTFVLGRKIYRETMNS